MKRDIKHTDTQTHRGTLLLLDQIGPVGRFDEKLYKGDKHTNIQIKKNSNTNTKTHKHTKNIRPDRPISKTIWFS